MKKLKLDWLAVQVISTFRELGFDEAYLADKEHELSGKDRFAVLLWCNNLDKLCLEALAGQLGIDAGDFAVTVKTIKRL
ncbi:MAG: hypothetical protein WC856_24590 [Methylococcaceae bacterium]|jgi:hypothetical protein